MSLHLPLLLVYCVLQVAVGLWIGRRVKTSGDFFVAGRALGPGLLFSTMVAANIGAGSTVGAAGLGYRDGIAAWWWVGSAAIGSVILAFTVGPLMRRVAAPEAVPRDSAPRPSESRQLRALARSSVARTSCPGCMAAGA